MANLKETFHAHTPSGRYEQYRAKHDYLLQQTQGEARYILEQKLDSDAKKDARRKVALEILGTAVVVTGAVFLGKELYNGTLTEDIRKAKEFFPNLITSINKRYDAFLHSTGKSVAEGMMESAAQHAGGIGSAAVEGVMAKVMEASPAIGLGASVIAEQAGDQTANAFIKRLESEMPHLAELVAASIRAAGLSIFFPRRA